MWLKVAKNKFKGLARLDSRFCGDERLHRRHCIFSNVLLSVFWRCITLQLRSRAGFAIQGRIGKHTCLWNIVSSRVYSSTVSQPSKHSVIFNGIDPSAIHLVNTTQLLLQSAEARFSYSLPQPTNFLTSSG